MPDIVITTAGIPATMNDTLAEAFTWTGRTGALAGYQYMPLLDGSTYVRTRYGENGTREVHSDDLQLCQEATNLFKRETVLNAILPTLGKALSKTSWLKKAQGSSNAEDIDGKAYQVAKEGGKHSNFYTQYITKSSEEIQRGIRSIEKQIAEHEDKIANPQKYIEDFSKLDPRQQEAPINRNWPSDIVLLLIRLFHGMLIL